MNQTHNQARASQPAQPSAGEAAHHAGHHAGGDAVHHPTSGPARSFTPGARPEVVPRDLPEFFHGQQVLYVLWERHLIICAPLALAVSPQLSFGALVQEELPRTVMAQHPDWPRIDWSQVVWQCEGRVLAPDPGQTLAELGLTHKTLLRLITPGLDGIAGQGG